MSGQHLHIGTVIGIVPNSKDLIQVTDGRFVICVYNPYKDFVPGGTYSLTKIGNTYALGAKLNGVVSGNVAPSKDAAGAL